MTAAIPRGRRSPVRLQIDDAIPGGERQGIGSILGLLTQNGGRIQSLRRTFSADMSTKEWLSANPHSSLKKNAASEPFWAVSLPGTSSPASSSSSGDGREVDGTSELKGEPKQPFDLWESLLAKPANHDDSPPYIHPSEVQSKFAMSQESLDMCTEWLGSETGSDGFRSTHCYTTYSSGEEVDGMAFRAPKKKKPRRFDYGSCGFLRRKITAPRTIPPLLSTLARKDGSRLQMRRRLEGGRLIVDAILVAAPDTLCAHRGDGHLRLSLLSPQEETKLQFKEDGEEEEEEEEETRVGDGGCPIPVTDCKIISKEGRHADNQSRWACRKFDEHRRGSTKLGGGAASFNGYDRFWRASTATVAGGKEPESDGSDKGFSGLRCNEERRHSVVRQPFIIATI